jgi:hypothetical protein
VWAASWISSAASSSEVVDIGGADRGGHLFDDLPVAQLAGLGHAQELKAVERLVLTTEVVCIISVASPLVSRRASRPAA